MLRDIDFENVARNNREIRKALRQALQAAHELSVQLNRVNGSPGGRQVLGHFAVSGADFQPAKAFCLTRRSRRNRLWRNTNSPGNFFAPAGIGKKMLP